jgi:hypothetical protein
VRRGEDGSWVRINFAHTEVPGRRIVAGPPTSRAGVRTIVIPEVIREDLVMHLRKRAALIYQRTTQEAAERTNEIEDQKTKAQATDVPALTWAFSVGADDGNRTRVFSLGS